MRKYLEDCLIELADIQNVEEALRKKLKYLKENESYARYDIENVETALRVISDLYSDVDEEEE